jgi:formamidopyrimidine-DNA glycosylase
MPELPEVETTVRALRQPLLGQTITGVRSDWPRQVIEPDIREMDARIGGRKIQSINRRGKYLVFGLEGGEHLIIHLKMSGHLSVVPAEIPPDKHVHTVFTLAGGRELRFRDTRKFGRVYLVQELDNVLGPLGPEPLSPQFTAEDLLHRLQGRRRVLKPLLLDQTFIAGIGNIYADEALHRAQLLPTRISNDLTRDESRALHSAIQWVLRLAITREGASIDNYRKPDGSKGEMQEAFAVYGRTGEPCHRCGAIIERMVLGGRSTHFCRSCQF